jgi:hypothetical protein
MTEQDITYSLSSFRNYEVNGIRELTKQEFDLFSGYIIALTKLESDENLLKIVEMNAKEVNMVVDKYVEMYESSKGSMTFMSDIMLDVNRLVLNYLSSIRTYLDHTETRLKREYGDNSEEYLKFKDLTSAAYDENFSYRFLYKLRNYAQHCGLPTGSISLSSHADGDGGTKTSLTLSLVRDELLNKFSSWGEKVKEELKKCEEHFDVLSLINHKLQILQTINSEINSQIYHKLLPAGQALFELMLEASAKEGAPCLIKASGTDEKLKMSIQWFPYSPISKVTGVSIIVKDNVQASAD